MHEDEYPSNAQTSVAVGPAKGILGGRFWACSPGVMRDPVCGLRRTPLPRTPV